MSNWWCGWVAYLWEDSSLSSWLSGSRERGGSMSDREAVLRDLDSITPFDTESQAYDEMHNRILAELHRLWAIEDAARAWDVDRQKHYQLHAALGKDTR